MILNPRRHFDLDAEEAEDVEPITFTWRGETYRCRGVMPALVPVRRQQATRAGELEDAAASSAMLELLEAVFEDGELDRILRTGIGLPSLLEVVKRVVAIQREGR